MFINIAKQTQIMQLVITRKQWSLISRGKCSSLVNYFDAQNKRANKNAEFSANRDSLFSENFVEETIKQISLSELFCLWTLLTLLSRAWFCCFWQRLYRSSCKIFSVRLFRSQCCDLPVCWNVYYCLPFEMAGWSVGLELFSRVFASTISIQESSIKAALVWRIHSTRVTFLSL